MRFSGSMFLCSGTELYLVKHDDGLTGIQLGEGIGTQIGKEHIKIILVVLEKVYDYTKSRMLNPFFLHEIKGKDKHSF